MRKKTSIYKFHFQWNAGFVESTYIGFQALIKNFDSSKIKLTDTLLQSFRKYVHYRWIQRVKKLPLMVNGTKILIISLLVEKDFAIDTAGTEL